MTLWLLNYSKFSLILDFYRRDRFFFFFFKEMTLTVSDAGSVISSQETSNFLQWPLHGGARAFCLCFKLCIFLHFQESWDLSQDVMANVIENSQKSSLDTVALFLLQLLVCSLHKVSQILHRKTMSTYLMPTHWQFWTHYSYTPIKATLE